MFSIFFGFSGAGGGGSSFFLGTTYGPTSFCGPPAAGGASCWFGFARGCGGVSGACAEKVVATPQRTTSVSRITRFREEADGTGFCLLNTPENIEKSSKHLC